MAEKIKNKHRLSLLSESRHFSIELSGAMGPYFVGSEDGAEAGVEAGRR